MIQLFLMMEQGYLVTLVTPTKKTKQNKKTTKKAIRIHPSPPLPNRSTTSVPARLKVRKELHVRVSRKWKWAVIHRARIEFHGTVETERVKHEIF